MSSAPSVRQEEPAGATAAFGSAPAPVPPGMDTARVASASILLLLTGTWAWWTVKSGAYFGAVFYPGLALLCAGLIVVLQGARWRMDVRSSRPVMLAFAGIFGLAAWSALSALWSPSADVAIADAQRIAGYGLCFGLGLWLCNLLGPRMHLSMAPLAIAAAVAGGAAAIVMLTGEDLRTYLESDGTLQFPLGYRNANAAFFAIALWPALGLARERALGVLPRAAALATATLCIELVLLSQSRGSLVAGPVALAVYVGLASGRARALAWLALALVPALVVLPSLGDLYSTVNEVSRTAALEELRSAGMATLGGAALAGIVGVLAAWAERRFAGNAEIESRADRIATRGVLGLLVVGAVGFVVATGNPIDWVGQRVDEFRNEGSPGFEDQSSRFSFNSGSGRVAFWRVALKDAESDPLFGSGGGGFQYSYLRERTDPNENARDAHSVELEVLSELGIPGLGMLALALAGAATGAIRARRLGPAAAMLSAVALAASTYWLLHASLDWFWTYPAVTAPVFGLLGSACAPALLAPDRPRGSGRRWASVAALLLALSVIPPFLSESYTENAFLHWREDPTRAFEDLDRARALNPLAEEPLMAEGAIALELGDRGRALTAFARAAERRPDEWAAHFFLAQTYLERPNQLAIARQELRLARGLNPLSAHLDALERSLRRREAGLRPSDG